MTSTVVVTIVVIAAIGWLAFLAVSALRSRGPEEVPSNLRPGTTDDVMETRRLERTQQAAMLLSAFLAVGLPLYYLGENQRQEGFVEQFDEESVERGLHLVEEFACYGCHGPDGVGGAATFVEPRTGVTVSWAAPSLNDIFFRYDRDLIRYWITFGRSNTPMPAWGVEGGGPMNDKQIEDIINYLETIQVDQDAVVAAVENTITSELQRLGNAEQAMQQAIVQQRQVVADIIRAETLEPLVSDLAAEAEELEERLGVGLDTDGDGVADAVEDAVSDLTARVRDVYVPEELPVVTFDPANPTSAEGIPDLQRAEEILETMRALVEEERAPILASSVTAIEQVLSGEEPVEEGEPADGEAETTTTTAAEEDEEAAEGEEAPPADQDGDGLTDQQEQQLNAQIDNAISNLLPGDLVVVELDPTNPETVPGESDLAEARRALSAIETLALNLVLQVENQDRILPPARQSLEDLLAAEEARRWEFDLDAIAAQAFDGEVERARRVVGIYQGYCARCHTSGYSAGIPYSQEAGSGGFGPALWDGREAVQFRTDEDLSEFLLVGAVANQPYGVNGMGSGRMPGFGMILSQDDIGDLAHWLRVGDLTGQGETGRAGR